MVTFTFQVPIVFPAKLKVQVSLDDETQVTPVAVMLLSPVFVRLTVGVPENPVPTKFVMLIVVVFWPVDGVMPVTVGAGAITVIYPAFRVLLYPPALYACSAT